MNEYIFAFRIKDDDRDCCKYIESTYHLDCVGEVILHGACFCGRWGDTPDYEDVETVLSEHDFYCLLSKGITEQDYNRIVHILTSDKGMAFFNEIIESEKEYLMDEYGLEESDIEQIYNEYYLDYRDRGIVGYVFDDSEEAGREYVNNCYTVPEFIANYIDYEKIGDNLCNDENYMMLDDNRVVRLNY